MEENKNNEVEVVEEETAQTQTVDEYVEEEVKEVSKPVKIVKKVFAILGSAILAFLIVVVGWLAIDKFILKSPVPSFAGYSHLVVTTGSMSGEIEAGDIIIIKKTNDYKVGDIITFMHEDETIPTTHRIIFDFGDTYQTKGDANPSDDTRMVHKDEIFGEVVKVIPKVGIFFDWIKQGGGLIYVVAIILIIGAGVYVIKKE